MSTLNLFLSLEPKAVFLIVGSISSFGGYLTESTLIDALT
jgi:hypothetical protein